MASTATSTDVVTGVDVDLNVGCMIILGVLEVYARPLRALCRAGRADRPGAMSGWRPGIDVYERQPDYWRRGWGAEGVEPRLTRDVYRRLTSGRAWSASR